MDVMSFCFDFWLPTLSKEVRLLIRSETGFFHWNQFVSCGIILICGYQTVSMIWTASWENVPSKTWAQRRLNSICESAQSDQSLCYLHEETAFLAIQNAPSEDSDQTARMRRLNLIFARHTCLKVRFMTLRSFIFCHWGWGRVHSVYKTESKFQTTRIRCTVLFLVVIVGPQRIINTCTAY